MYLEREPSSREGWKYDYTGSEILPFAKALYDAQYLKEGEIRQEISALMEDRTISMSSDRIKKLEQDANFTGRTVEQLRVWPMNLNASQTDLIISLSEMWSFSE